MLWCEWGIIRHLVRPGVHLHHIPLNACLYVEMAFFIIVFFFWTYTSFNFLLSIRAHSLITSRDYKLLTIRKLLVDATL